MSEWKEVKLGDVVDIGSSKRIFYSEYVKIGIPFYRSKEIIERYKGNEVSTELFITEAKFNEIKEKFGVPIKDDILLTSVGTLGIPYIVNEADKFYFKDGNLTWFKNYTNHILSLFLYYWIISPIGKNELEMSSIGSTQAALTIKGLKGLDILLPSLKEQKAITEVLSSLDDKIDLFYRQNKTLESLAQTLFRQWFIEEADDKWEVHKLNDFISVKHGYAFKGKFITTEKNKQILVTPGNFKIGGGFKTAKMKYYSEFGYPKEYIFSPNDLTVIMTDLSKEGDTLGYPALIPAHNQEKVSYLHNQRVGKIIFKKTISKYFIYFLMKTDVYQWYILGGASGTSVRHTSPTSICNFSFRVPPMEKIQEFDDKAYELITKIHKNTTQIKTLENMRDTLLPKLMSGKVRVK